MDIFIYTFVCFIAYLSFPINYRLFVFLFIVYLLDRVKNNCNVLKP